MVLFIQKNIFFGISLILLIALSSMRSAPVFGKLDFILLDGRPWWISWRPMIESVISQGENKKIVSDMITCTVLRGVFAQKAVSFRFDYNYNHVKVEDLLQMNKKKVLPVGAVILLLQEKASITSIHTEQQNRPEASVRQLMVDVVMSSSGKIDGTINNGSDPYRCVINMHSYSASWVPIETGHWSVEWAEPAFLYEFQGKHGKEITPLLKSSPPDNCMVYY